MAATLYGSAFYVQELSRKTKYHLDLGLSFQLQKFGSIVQKIPSYGNFYTGT